MTFILLVLLVTMHLALCSLVGRPMMLDITAVYGPQGQLRHGAHVRLQKTAESPQLQSVQVVDISFGPAQADPHCPGYSADH